VKQGGFRGGIRPKLEKVPPYAKAYQLAGVFIVPYGGSARPRRFFVISIVTVVRTFIIINQSLDEANCVIRSTKVKSHPNKLAASSSPLAGRSALHKDFVCRDTSPPTI
jgi:hypothetical protein